MRRADFPSNARLEPAASGFGERVAARRRRMVATAFLSSGILRKRARPPHSAVLFYLTRSNVQFERLIAVLVNASAYLNLVTKIAGTPHAANGMSPAMTRIALNGGTYRGEVKGLPSSQIPIIYGLTRISTATAGFPGGIKKMQPRMPGEHDISPMFMPLSAIHIIVPSIGRPSAMYHASTIMSRAEEANLVNVSPIRTMFGRMARKEYKSGLYSRGSVEHKARDFGRLSGDPPHRSALVHASPFEIMGGPAKSERAVSKHFDVSRSEDFTLEGSKPRAGLTDIKRLADEVYGLIDRKIRIERERRGIIR